MPGTNCSPKRVHYGRSSSISDERMPGSQARHVAVAAAPAARLTASAHNVTHNAGSQRSQNTLTSRPPLPDVVFSNVHDYNSLWLTSLAETSEFHLDDDFW